MLITCRQMQNCIAMFRHRFDERSIEVDMPLIVQQPTEDELIAIIGLYDGMIAGDDPLTKRVLAHADRMRVISKWGVGVDGIDLDDARSRGIAVMNTPGVFGDDVADVAMGYVVMLARQLHRIHESVEEGGWLKHEGRVLSGSTLGIAGLGTIGRAISRRARGFGLKLIAHDVAPGAFDNPEASEVSPVSLDDLFRLSDFLVLSAPLTAETMHMVNSRTLGLMKRGSYLINVARGPLVDEHSLAAALQARQIAAAALDVFEEEPLPSDSRLREFTQCVFGTHNASNTTEGVLRASAQAVDNLFSVLDDL